MAPHNPEDTTDDGHAMPRRKILFLAANPVKSNLLALDEEIRAITAKIRDAEYRERLDLVSAWAVRADDLLQALNEHQPQIVHFSGHGTQAGELVLVSKAGKPHTVPPAALKATFTTLKDNVRMVVLNACYSKAQAQAIVEVIDCAVGMNSAIGDEAAIVFAASFYRAIGFGRSAKEAYDQGIAALLLEGIPEDQTPELLCRDGVDPASVVLVEEDFDAPHPSIGDPIESGPTRDFYKSKQTTVGMVSRQSAFRPQDYERNRVAIMLLHENRQIAWLSASAAEKKLQQVTTERDTLRLRIGELRGEMTLLEYRLDKASDRDSLHERTSELASEINKLKSQLATATRQGTITFVMSLFATILAGFGINVITDIPRNWVGWTLVGSACLMEGLAFLSKPRRAE